MTTTSPASMGGPLAVLHHAADTIDNLDPHRKARLEDGCGGGYVFGQLFESAKHLYAGAAILHLERHLGIPQLQYWDVKDADEAAAALREAAGLHPEPDLEVAALERRLRDLHAELSAALESDEVATGALVGQISRMAERHRTAVARLEQQRDDARAQLRVLEGQLATAQELHQPKTIYTEWHEFAVESSKRTICERCTGGDPDDYYTHIVEWPCATAKALGLDGGDPDAA